MYVGLAIEKKSLRDEAPFQYIKNPAAEQNSKRRDKHDENPAVVQKGKRRDNYDETPPPFKTANGADNYDKNPAAETKQQTERAIMMKTRRHTKTANRA